MSKEVLIFIGGTGLAIIAFLIQILLQRVILKKLDDNEITIKQISEKQTTFHMEVLNTYVRKEDHEDHKACNEKAHEKLWIEIHAKGELLAKVEERINIRNEIINAVEMLKGG